MACGSLWSRNIQKTMSHSPFMELQHETKNDPRNLLEFMLYMGLAQYQIRKLLINLKVSFIRVEILYCHLASSRWRLVYLDNISRPPTTLNDISLKARVLLLLAIATMSPRLQPDRDVTPLISRPLTTLIQSLPPPLIEDSDNDLDNLGFNLGNLSITLSSTNTNINYYFCDLTQKNYFYDLISLFVMFNLFNLSSVRVVLTLVSMICDIFLNHVSMIQMLNLVVQFVMIYIMVLIWKLPNISTELSMTT
jgi:hypothetical protein